MTKTEEHAGDTVSLVYRCRLNLSTRTVTYLADLLRSHLKAIRSPFRSLPPGRIAVLVLAMLRHDQRLLDLAGGNNVPETTLRRWRDEMIGLLAARAPRLDRALRKIAKRGGEVVLIDGTLIPTQRRTGADDRPNHWGKHHRHGLHFLALTDEKGRLIWISAARPGRTHDATAARHDKIVEHLKAAGLGALADLGFIGVDKPDDPDDLVSMRAGHVDGYGQLDCFWQSRGPVYSIGGVLNVPPIGAAARLQPFAIASAPFWAVATPNAPTRSVAREVTIESRRWALPTRSGNGDRRTGT